MFFLLFISNILINCDHGTLPGSTQQIEQKLNINNFGFGILGSVVFAGLTIGSAMASVLYSNSDMIKPTLSFSLLLNAICLVAFTFSTNIILSCVLRVFIGFF